MNSSSNKSFNLEFIQKKWRLWAIGFCVWTILALSFSIRGFLQSNRAGTDFSWREALSGNLIDFYMWALISPLIFKISRWFPIEREKLAGRISLHIVLCAIFSFVLLAVSLPTLYYVGYPNPVRYPTVESFFYEHIFNPYYLHQGILIYWSTVVVAHAFEYYGQLRVKKIQAAELSAQLAQAQLSALKMQVHPHFLFNTLNSIAALLHKDVELADKMIARLSDFLRMTLKSSDTPITTLNQELEFLKTYLEIEKIRFQEKLIINIETDPRALEAQVPNLILQPLVENAVRHGVARQKSVGRLEVFARRVNDRLFIEIKDNGPGLQNGHNIKRKSPGAGGVGLRNTRARLEQFYENDFEFEISNKPDEPGTVVNLNVPFLV